MRCNALRCIALRCVALRCDIMYLEHGRVARRDVHEADDDQKDHQEEDVALAQLPLEARDL